MWLTRFNLSEWKSQKPPNKKFSSIKATTLSFSFSSSNSLLKVREKVTVLTSRWRIYPNRSPWTRRSEVQTHRLQTAPELRPARIVKWPRPSTWCWTSVTPIFEKTLFSNSLRYKNNFFPFFFFFFFFFVYFFFG